MIARTFTPPVADAVWDAWINSAESATSDLLLKASIGQIITSDDIVGKIYKGVRTELFTAFQGKCAFCEVIFANDQPGDVEHYRPKCGVLDEQGNPVPGHNGYYWLAYHWKNLLPSCADCNRGRYDRDGKFFGKAEYFPVRGQRALQPGEEALEQPLLLNPTIHDPNDHLIFDPKTGFIAGKTDEGRTTISILGLNRERLPETRKKAYSAARSALTEVAGACFLNEERTNELLTELEDHKSGKSGYSMAARRALEDFGSKLTRVAQALIQPAKS